MKNSKPIVDSVNCQIHNGGVSFGVTNECGPTVEIAASHFGHITNHIVLHLTPEGLKKLGYMFHQAAEYGEFDVPYACAAETNIVDRVTGSYKDKEPSVANDAIGQEQKPKE